MVCLKWGSQIYQITSEGWPIIAGSIHVFFEGYFVYNNSQMSSMQDLFGQLWKEYALSDSRYMTSDPLVLCMESLTVVRAFIPNQVNPTDGEKAYMGSIVIVDSCADYKRITVSPSLSSSGINRPVLRKSHLLFDLLVWRFCPWKALLSTGTVLFLVVFFLHELILVIRAGQ